MKAERRQNFENGTKMGRQRYSMGYVWKQIIEDLKAILITSVNSLYSLHRVDMRDLQRGVINCVVSACILSNVDSNVKGTFLFMRLRGGCF